MIVEASIIFFGADVLYVIYTLYFNKLGCYIHEFISTEIFDPMRYKGKSVEYKLVEDKLVEDKLVEDKLINNFIFFKKELNNLIFILIDIIEYMVCVDKLDKNKLVEGKLMYILKFTVYILNFMVYIGKLVDNDTFFKKETNTLIFNNIFLKEIKSKIKVIKNKLVYFFF